MAKDPAFLFYPNDYIGGTMGMTFEEKGAYIELLMLQFNRGHMTEHMIAQTIGQVWLNIKCKFKIDTNGLYYNERLDIEVEKRKSFVKSRNNNREGKNQYTKKEESELGHMTTHMTGHMEDGDEDSFSSIKNSIDYNLIIENYHTLCPNMAKVEKLTDKRKGFVNARFGEYGMDGVTKVLRMAGESEFLNGHNDRVWKADFEWIMRPENFVKILEGKYTKVKAKIKLSA